MRHPNKAQGFLQRQNLRMRTYYIFTNKSMRIVRSDSSNRKSSAELVASLRCGRRILCQLSAWAATFLGGIVLMVSCD